MTESASAEGGAGYTNRLAGETSPYLLQHAHNPVDWYPWGEEAFARARAEDKLIFLSIGYSACHWCHVMERESFENEGIARLLNEHYVSIKVDREERPDVDGVYMQAVQLMTGSGGWPLSVFLMPDLKPFFGGTYFPPEDRWGRPGFSNVLVHVAELWRERETDVHARAGGVAASVAQSLALESAPGGEVGEELLEAATEQLSRTFDPVWGGFGGAPKFPPYGSIALLLREYCRTGQAELLEIVTVTLDRMAAGGMYDQLGGGFHRYAVDTEWLVPHFEKMLYDNALLSHVYLEAYQLTGKDAYRRIARETLDYVLRDMEDERGGFHSAEDADSEGEEGLFYVWSRAEIEAVLGAGEAELFASFYGVTEAGNFEGHNILHRPQDLAAFAAQRGESPDALRERLDASGKRLFERRAGRVRPGLDDKVLTSWNGLMISSLTLGYRALGDPRYLAAAERAARFVLRDFGPDRGLMHTHRAGQSKVDGFLDDYAFLARAAIDLYTSTFETQWLARATALADRMHELFDDPNGGGYFLTSALHDQLPARAKPLADGPVPSGNAVAADALYRIASLTGDTAYADRADAILAAASTPMSRFPRAFAYMLVAAGHPLSGGEIAILGHDGADDTTSLLASIRSSFLPYHVVAALDPADPNGSATASTIPVLAGRGLVDDRAAAYVCRNFACERPVTNAAALTALVDPRRAPPAASPDSPVEK